MHYVLCLRRSQFFFLYSKQGLLDSVRLVNTVIMRNCLAGSVVPPSQHSINQQSCVQVTSTTVLYLEKKTGTVMLS